MLVERILRLKFWEKSMRVVAFVARGFSSKSWNERYREGKLVGINEPYAYGYYLAEHMGCQVLYSEDHEYNPLQSILRLVIRASLGFDLMHAWRNRALLYSADVIWTHTESQYLALAFMSVILRRPLPKTIGQSVWLMDSMKSRPIFYNSFYRFLAAKIDVLTFHSDLNAEACRQWLPGKDVRVVRFGINCRETWSDNSPKPGDRPRVIAVGNDRHRDWATLIQQFANTAYDLRIVSTKFKTFGPLPDNIRVEGARDNAELKAAYDQADLAVVPLTSNMHASGITSIFEAILCSRPVIATDTGGLRGYFPDGGLVLVDPACKDGLRLAADQLLSSPERLSQTIIQGRERLKLINSDTYVEQHVNISKELLGLSWRL